MTTFGAWKTPPPPPWPDWVAEYVEDAWLADVAARPSYAAGGWEHCYDCDTGEHLERCVADGHDVDVADDDEVTRWRAGEARSRWLAARLAWAKDHGVDTAALPRPPARKLRNT